MLLDISHIDVDNLENELLDKKQICLSVIRLDKIHPVISGNKLFKLHYFLQEAIQSSHQTIITFGVLFLTILLQLLLPANYLT
jgi:1-aminocyclopropane-1-carboxylate deaminase